MSQTPTSPGEPSRDPLADLLAQYLDARNAGEQPDLEEFLQRCPEDHRSELRRSIELMGESGTPHLAPPRQFGDYEIVREIGRGGMGVVYEARQHSLNRTVALKVLAPWVAQLQSAKDRFLREAQSVGRLQHPNLVSVHAVGEEQGHAFIAMEMVPGRGLDEILREAKERGERVPIPQLLRWIAGIARGLQCAHEAGIIHRDVKPSNIRITPDDRALLLDFGLARDSQAMTMTKTGEFAGSPYYCSPEQVAAKRIGIDARTDIYSLGVTLYEAVTGKLPFEGETTEQVFSQILLKEPPLPRKVNPAVPRDLETVILKAMEKDQEYRYQAASDVDAELEAVLGLRPIKAKSIGVSGRLLKWVRRNRLAASLLVVPLFLTSVWVTATYFQGRFFYSNFRDMAAMAEDSFQSGKRKLAMAFYQQAIEYYLENRNLFQSVAPRDLLLARSRLSEIQALERAAEAEIFRAERDEKEKALKEKQAALTAEKEARIRATGERLIAQAQAAAFENPSLALLLGIEAARRAPGSLVNSLLYKALASCHEEKVFFEGDSFWKAAVFLEGNRDVIAVDHDSLRVWDTITNQAVKSSKISKRQLTDIVLSPDGTLVCAVSLDGQPYLAHTKDPETRNLLLPGVEFDLLQAVFSPDSSKLFMSSLDGKGVVWNANTGETEFTLPKQRVPITRAEFSRNAEILITWSGYTFHEGKPLSFVTGNGVSAWNLRLRKQIATTATSPGSEILLDERRSLSIAAALNAAGTKLAVGKEDGIDIWSLEDLDTSGRVYSIKARKPVSLAFSPQYDLLLSFPPSGGIEAYSILSEPRKENFDRIHGHVQTWCFSPDGKTVALAVAESIFVYRLDTGQQLLATRSHSGGYFTIAFSSDSRRLVTTSRDGTIRTWNISQAAAGPKIAAHEDIITGIDFSADNGLMLTSSKDHQCKIWSDVSLKSEIELQALVLPERPHAFFTNKTNRIVVCPKNFAIPLLWDLSTGSFAGSLLGHRAPIVSSDLSSDRKTLITISNFDEDHSVRIWDLDDSRCVKVFSSKSSDDEFSDAKFFNHDKQIALAERSRILLLDGKTWEQEKVIEIQHGIQSIQISPNGELLAVSNFSNKIQIKTLPEGDHVCDISMIDDPYSTGALFWSRARDAQFIFSPDSRFLMVHFGQWPVKIYECSSWGEVGTFTELDFSPSFVTFALDSKSVVFGSEDGFVRWFPIEPYERAVQMAPRRLTQEERTRYGLQEVSEAGSLSR